MDDEICAEVVLEPSSSAYFLSHSPLFPPLKNFKKWPILVFFQIGHSSELPACLEPRFAAECCPMNAL